MASYCEWVDEPSGSIKYVEFLTDNQLASQEGLCSMELVTMYVRSENNNIVSCLNYATQCVCIYIYKCIYIYFLYIFFNQMLSFPCCC